MQKKRNVNKIWLPSIFVTALSLVGVTGAVAEEFQMPQQQQQPMSQQQAQAQGLQVMLQDLQQRFPEYSTERVVVIDATAQRLLLVQQGQVVREWVISTASKGLGSKRGSNKTPLGVHRVAQKIGDGAELGAIFKARRNTGRVAEILTEPGARSNADNVTTRILWLDGLEPGRNKGGSVDSHGRYIYIHGTDEEGRLGDPASHGCIRMRNTEVVELFDLVTEDTLVVIAKTPQGY